MVTADGLPELIRAFKKVDTGKKLSEVTAPVQPEVARLVETRSRARAISRQMSKAEATNRYLPRKASVSVIVGGSGSVREWAVGAQFGSKHYRQFPRPPGRDGYTVIPAAKANRDDIADIYGRAIQAAIDNA